MWALVNQCRFFTGLGLFLLDYNTHEFTTSRLFTLARLCNLVVAGLLRLWIVRPNTYKLNHYLESTTIVRDVTFISQKRSICKNCRFLPTRFVHCVPTENSHFNGSSFIPFRAWPLNINNWVFNSINPLSTLLMKMLVFHWHLSTVWRRFNQTQSPPIL